MTPKLENGVALSAIFVGLSTAARCKVPAPHPSACGDTNKNKIYFGVSSHAASGGAARGSASFRSADAAQVCNNVGFVFGDGVFECSEATAARQIVSERR